MQQQQESVDLSVSLGPIVLQNPVMTASGTCGYSFELSYYTDLSRIGGFVTKSITLEPRIGNTPRRTAETPAGMLNAIGLANVGLDEFCEQKTVLLERMTVPVFVNVAGRTIEEYVQVSRRVSQFPMVRGLELNISCPNVKEGGITFGTDPKNTYELVSAVRKECPETFLIVKLTPNVTDISITARAAVDAGANALSLINTLIGMAIDAEKRCCILSNRTGGLSGPAIKPIALYMVNKVYREVAKPGGIPIIGLGGIQTGTDALEFMIAGATAVAVGTNVLVDPSCLERIVEEIREYLVRHHLESIRTLIGSLE